MKKLSVIIAMMVFMGILSFSSLATVTSQGFSPVGGSWVNSIPFNFTFTCSGNSTNSEVGYNATLYHDIGRTSILINHTLDNLADAVTSNITMQATIPDNSSGYQWVLECKNNLTGERTNSSTYGFRVDDTNPTIPDIDQPLNRSVQGSVNPFINWSNSTEANFKQYKIQFANATNFLAVNILKEFIITSRTTTSISAFTSTLDADRTYFLRVLAEDEAGNTNFQYHNLTIAPAVPTITINQYLNSTYTNVTQPLLNITATANFLSACELWTSDPDDTNFKLNITNLSGISPVAFHPALSDGATIYSFQCNNTGGNKTSFTVNRTLFVDRVRPFDFACRRPTVNNTKSLDHTPYFEWNESTDRYFANYSYSVDDTAGFTSVEVTGVAVGGNNTNASPNVRPYNQTDRTWLFKVNATDRAGNVAEGLNCSQLSPIYYRTDITNHYLKSGWNQIVIVQTGTTNSTTIANSLGHTWTTISKYNSSKQFQNYNNGTTTNNDMIFKKGDVVFIKVNEDTYFENQTWDTDTGFTSQLINLTNFSGGWNAIGVQNQTGLQLGQIEYGILKSNRREGGVNGSYYFDIVNVSQLPSNLSLLEIVMYNWSSGKYVVHPANYSQSNLTLAEFGEVVWVHINESINGSSNLRVLNQSHIGDPQ